jgi:hypothetical protein
MDITGVFFRVLAEQFCIAGSKPYKPGHPRYPFDDMAFLFSRAASTIAPYLLTKTGNFGRINHWTPISSTCGHAKLCHISLPKPSAIVLAMSHKRLHRGPD